MNDNATPFAVYCVGDVGDDMTPALQRVLVVHRKRYGCPPVGLVVNKSLVGKARQALVTLGLASLEVKGNGGCLAWEVWLPRDSGNDQSASVLRRVEVTQQPGTTPLRGGGDSERKGT